MTPSARLQAAIEVLDQYLAGAPVEKTLTNWARKSRYAGSKDRAAVRDIVFQCVRCRSSYAAVAGIQTGRGLAIGYVVDLDGDIAAWFDGSQYGPAAISENGGEGFKTNGLSGDLHVGLDAPEWLIKSLQRALGDELEPVMTRLKTRAPIFVRVNTSKATPSNVIDLLAAEDIVARPNSLTPTALEITENPRKINNCNALQDGLIELQDAASQAVCQTVLFGPQDRILDYCAGGGGKALALADRPHKEILAYDVNQSRMGDIPVRARRAGVKITPLSKSTMVAKAPFDVVFCDVPCSGSGAWRRSPEGKWSFSQSKLDDLLSVQSEILKNAADLVTPDGLLAYATCSLLCEENEDRIGRFLEENPDWTVTFSRRFSPLEGGDGFFVAHLTRVKPTS